MPGALKEPVWISFLRWAFFGNPGWSLIDFLFSQEAQPNGGLKTTTKYPGSAAARSAVAEKPSIVCRASVNRKKALLPPENAKVDDIDNTLPIAVLDTNVVLDWLVFRNPSVLALVETLGSGRLQWVATEAMREELHHVLSRGHLAAWRPGPVEIWAHWDRHCTLYPTPAPRRADRLRCSDPDDQKFVDLAREGADWLLTRDRALLVLAPRLRSCGVRIVTPEAWTEASRGR